MSKKRHRHLAFLPLLAATAFAGTPVVPVVEPPEVGFDIAELFPVANVKYVGSFGMDFDNSAGELDTHAFQASAILSKPIDLFDSWQLIPQFSYEAMLLSTDGPLPSVLVGDEDLHEIELALYFLRIKDTTPWIYGAWVDTKLASDFQGISGDDVFIDVVGAVAYQFNDRFIAGLGVGALNVTGDLEILAGPGVFWQPTDETFVALYGPIFRATHDLNPKWTVGLEVRPNGGLWNLDTALGSVNLDYTNFRAGLTSSHNLAGDLWLSYGGGITFGGSLNVTTTDGSKIFQNQLDDLESGFYGFVSLDLKSW
jgi:hypothetical protein